MAKDYIIVETTCDTREEAERLSWAILNTRLGACVQIVPGLQSTYWWKDEITSSEEFLLRVKTVDGKFERLKRVILDNHSYEIPEIIATKIEYISEDYAKWLDSELNL